MFKKFAFWITFSYRRIIVYVKKHTILVHGGFELKDQVKLTFDETL